MKRHPALRDLSSDHHGALVQAHRLKGAEEATRHTLAAEFLSFFEAHANPHFREEEEALLPFYARWGDIDAPPIRQMQGDHVLIRRDTAMLRDMAAVIVEALRALGARLEAHVRLEERVVFPLIEDCLPSEALDALPAHLAAWKEATAGNGRTAEKPMSKLTLPDHRLPGAQLQTHKMPGHWLLARLGKKVLRPGGLELTHKLLDSMNIGPEDRVVELAPGLGATAELALAKHPAVYTAIERDEAALDGIRRKLAGANREFRVGSAEETGLPGLCASVVYGEAMLTMQTPATKETIVAEAARLLVSGGCYGIHELALVPDDLDETAVQEISAALGGSIHVGARPLRPHEWRTLLESAGLVVTAEHRAPMELLEPARMIHDEGIGGALHIMWNALHDEEALARVREMRAVFHKYRDNLEAIALVAHKR